MTVLLRRTIPDHLHRSRPQKTPQRIPASTLPAFPGLRPRSWSCLLRLATKAMSDRLLEGGMNRDYPRGSSSRISRLLLSVARTCFLREVQVWVTGGETHADKNADGCGSGQNVPTPAARTLEFFEIVVLLSAVVTVSGHNLDRGIDFLPFGRQCRFPQDRFRSGATRLDRRLPGCRR